MIELRDYQSNALDELRNGFLKGFRRQILCLPTGAGKTRLAAAMMTKVSATGKRCAFVADRRVLVEQTSRMLFDMDVPHGVIMSGETKMPYENIQVCSAQTLEARNLWPDINLLIVDEAHTQRKATLEYMMNRNVMTIGLTATPFTKGLGKFYEHVVNGEVTNNLIQDGWLSPVKVFLPPQSQIDMHGISPKAGEWTNKSTSERARIIIGDIPSEWQKNVYREFGGPVKSIVFVPTISYARDLASEFNQLGYLFEHVSYKDRDSEERRKKIDSLSEGKIDGLISVECLVKGLDIPDIKCVVSARPYLNSLTNHIQSIGRGARPFKGKDFFILIDHTFNYIRFQGETEEFWNHGCHKLDMGEKKESASRKRPEYSDKLCPVCGFLIPIGVSVEICPSCGASRKEKSRIEVVGGSLVSLYKPTFNEHSRNGNNKLTKEISLDGDVWSEVCYLIERNLNSNDVERKLKSALSAYKNVTGKWPKGGKAVFSPGNYCRPEIAEKVYHYRNEYRKRKIKESMVNKWLKSNVNSSIKSIKQQTVTNMD